MAGVASSGGLMQALSKASVFFKGKKSPCVLPSL